MGALEYIPATSPFDSTIENVNISKMVEFASDVLSDRKDKLINLKDNAGYSQLVLLGTSAGGARAKALIAWNEDTGEIKSENEKSNVTQTLGNAEEKNTKDIENKKEENIMKQKKNMVEVLLRQKWEQKL